MAPRHKTSRARTGPAPLTADAARALLRQAAVHRVEGRYDEAVGLYETVERADPAAVDAPYFLALIDLVRDRPAPALDRLLKLTRRLPASFDVWQALAHTRRALGQWREATAASRRALSLRPTDAHEQFELATALEVGGDLDEAIAVLRGLAAARRHAPAAPSRASPACGRPLIAARRTGRDGDGRESQAGTTKPALAIIAALGETARAPGAL